jgi:hypothetical protein
MVLYFYKITTLSNKILAECLVTLLWKNRIDVSKYIIKDRVNSENIDEFLYEFERYAGNDNLNSDDVKELHNILKEIKSHSDVTK